MLSVHMVLMGAAYWPFCTTLKMILQLMMVMGKVMMLMVSLTLNQTHN